MLASLGGAAVTTTAVVAGLVLNIPNDQKLEKHDYFYSIDGFKKKIGGTDEFIFDKNEITKLFNLVIGNEMKGEVISYHKSKYADSKYSQLNDLYLIKTKDQETLTSPNVNWIDIDTVDSKGLSFSIKWDIKKEELENVPYAIIFEIRKDKRVLVELREIRKLNDSFAVSATPIMSLSKTKVSDKWINLLDFFHLGKDFKDSSKKKP